MPGDVVTINHSIPGPSKLSFTGNLAVNFKRFKRAWTVYEAGSRIKEQNAAVRACCLQAYLSEDALEVLEGLPFDADADRQDADKILSVLEKRFGSIGTVKTLEDGRRGRGVLADQK